MNGTNAMQALWAIYLRGLIILRRRLWKNIVSLFLSPALYALAFGWGLGRSLEVEGVSYLRFMLPGLIALSGMKESFSISLEINYSRFLNHFFEEYLLSPAKSTVVVLGNVLYGITKGMASLIAVLLIGFLFGTRPQSLFTLLPAVLLNTVMFASLGVWIALSVTNHRDLNSFTSFVIVPMSFIAGTFFSMASLPPVFGFLANIIPLTHASLAIRAAFLGTPVSAYHYWIMLGYCLFFFSMAVRRVRKAVV